MQILPVVNWGMEKSDSAQHHSQKQHSLKRGLIFSTAEHLWLLQPSLVALGGEIQARVDLILTQFSVSCVLMGRKDLCWSTHL